MRLFGLAALLLLLNQSMVYADDPIDPIDHMSRSTLALTVAGGTMLDVDRTEAGKTNEQPAAGLGLLDWDSIGLAKEGTIAVALSFMQPLMRYAALGFEAQFRSWASRQDIQLGYPRYQALDFSLLPRGQLPVSRRVAFIATLPLGASASFIDADIEHRTFKEQASLGYGFNLGLFAGVSFAMQEHLGMRFELGVSQHWLHHRWSYTSTTQQPFANEHEDVSYATTTMLLRVSVYYAL